MFRKISEVIDIINLESSLQTNSLQNLLKIFIYMNIIFVSSFVDNSENLWFLLLFIFTSSFLIFLFPISKISSIHNKFFCYNQQVPKMYSLFLNFSLN